MKKSFFHIISLTLIFFISLQSVNLIVYYSLFKINQESLAEEYCEKIILDCNACCFLEKKMAEDNSETSAPENIQINHIKLALYNSENLSFNLFANKITYQYILNLNYSLGFNQIPSPIPIV
ncbi:MAG TPA: hypothetical protein PLG90_01125 [Ignavibacteria bacterium]|nr:hypothetical protein [Ignavibacteria bacterium]